MVSQGRRFGLHSKGGGGTTMVLKKGPWTAAEDAILMEYVQREGEGNWKAVQNNSGLKRCGKSCRLRWANHLRPFLKKGPFTVNEENTITQLHFMFGNKWARMASQLPGRTDNEIKNYWNTRSKRLQRAGLPIYPFESLPQYKYYRPPQNISISSSSSNFASVISAEATAFSSTSNQNQNSVNFMTNCTLLDYQKHHSQDNMNPSNNNALLSDNDILNQTEPYSQAFLGKALPFDMNIGPSSSPYLLSNNNTNTSFNHVRLFGMGSYNNELSSIQNRIQAPNDFVYVKSDNEVYDDITRGNSGLLLDESQTIKCCNDNSNKYKMAKVEEEMNIMDDDLLRLLDSPSPVCIPDWHDIGTSGSNTTSNHSSGEPSNVTTTLVPHKKADDNDDWDESFCFWKDISDVIIS